MLGATSKKTEWVDSIGLDAGGSGKAPNEHSAKSIKGRA
jgi:hypothetical protein